METLTVKNVCAAFFIVGLCCQSVLAQDGAASGVLRFESFAAAGRDTSIPPPFLLEKPAFTQGVGGDTLCVVLPPRSSIPIDSLDFVALLVHVFVDGDSITSFADKDVKDSLGDTVNVSVNFDDRGIPSGHGLTYQYYVTLRVKDHDTGIIYESAPSNIVQTTHDNQAVLVSDPGIPQRTPTPVPGWSDQSTIQVEANLSDSAGIWKVFLYQRTDALASDWGAPADSTIVCTESERTGSGFVCDTTVRVSFPRTLADGFYQFRIEGVDATHTPESCFPNFELAGNGGQPAADAPAHVQINIDTTPPVPIVLLNCQQVLSTVELDWSASSDSGVGLAQYFIVRNSVPIDSVAAGMTSYIDSLKETDEQDFVYQIQPGDSLGNIQTEGAACAIHVDEPPEVVMEDEPEFTPGLSNEVCWTSEGTIVSFELFLDAGCDTVPDRSIVLPGDVSCFTFDDLVDGTKYCYWVVATDKQGRRATSKVDSSIQDATAPVIESFGVVADEVVSGKKWVYQNQITFDIRARDFDLGKICTYELQEEALVPIVDSFPDPNGVIQERFSSETDAAMRKRIEFCVRVVDCAGNVSDSICDTVYFAIPEEDIVIRPNPFNPLKRSVEIEVTEKVRSDNDNNRIRIFDLFGNLVRELVIAPGTRTFVWDGRNGKGDIVGNGGYICVWGNKREKIAVLKRK